jgi:peptide/nickel transport system permease protein
LTRLGAAIRRSGIAAIRHDTVALVSLAFLIVVVGLAIGADFLAPHSPTEVNLRLRNVPPLTPSEDGLPYLLGTDSVGRDIVSRLMHGARVSLVIGFSTVAIAGLFGVALGVVAGYRGGLIDGLVMRTVDVLLGLPGLLAALFVLFVIGPGLLNLILVLAVLRWTIYTRVTRGMVLVLREQGFVRSSRSVGASDLRIMRRHILPNMISPLIVLATLEVGVIILAEAGLSFLGFGIQQPAASWGLDVAFGREYITSAWWVVTFPGLAILLTVLALNIFATSLRGVLDPLHRWRWATD